MSNDEAIKYLQQIYPHGGHSWLDEQRTEAIRMAIEAFKARKGKEYYIPQIKSKVVAGFSVEAIMDIFSAINAEIPMKAEVQV